MSDIPSEPNDGQDLQTSQKQDSSKEPKKGKVEESLIKIILEIFGRGVPGFTFFLLHLLISGKIAIPVISAFTFNLLFSQVANYWDRVPLLFDSFSNRLLCAVIVVFLGAFFYFIRERKRFLYASLELGVGAATAYNAAAKLFQSHDTNAALLTLLGSIYISVRAFDNYNKFYSSQSRLI